VSRDPVGRGFDAVGAEGSGGTLYGEIFLKRLCGVNASYLNSVVLIKFGARINPGRRGGCIRVGTAI
jgi:hypothetical protein